MFSEFRTSVRTRPATSSDRQFGRTNAARPAHGGPSARPTFSGGQQRFSKNGPVRSNHGRPRFNGSGNRGGNRARFQGQYIDPAKFVHRASAEQVTADTIAPTHTFADFGLLPALQRTLAERGFTVPTTIQDQALPHVLAGKDLIGLANTGTGKTAAFLLPLIQRLKTTHTAQTALILAPTRELAQQINEDLRTFSKGLGIFSALCVGGMSIGRQISELKRRPQIVIGTPGRLKDLLERRVLQLGRVGYLVLDEADRMLDMGFIKDIRHILSFVPRERQSLCLSATITPAITELLKDVLRNPVTVSVRTGDTSAQVDQDVIEASTPAHKLELLQGLLRQPHFERVLVFGATKHGVQKLADTLTRSGHPAEAIHGNKSQPKRARALDAFKAGRVGVLVATDVAARGLDIPNVSHVINFDQPMTYSDYVHRIGRTGRAGKRGQALTFIPPRSRETQAVR